MSTGAGCSFTEVKPGQYTYWLQDWPYGETPEGETFGPFASFRAALVHLDAHHANPGGWDVRTLPEGQHRHEWRAGEGWAPVGFEVSTRVESLGPKASREEVIAFVQGLPPDHPAFKVRSVDGLRTGIVECEACGQRKD